MSPWIAIFIAVVCIVVGVVVFVLTRKASSPPMDDQPPSSSQDDQPPPVTEGVLPSIDLCWPGATPTSDGLGCAHVMGPVRPEELGNSFDTFHDGLAACNAEPNKCLGLQQGARDSSVRIVLKMMEETGTRVFKMSKVTGHEPTDIPFGVVEGYLRILSPRFGVGGGVDDTVSASFDEQWDACVADPDCRGIQNDIDNNKTYIGDAANIRLHSTFLAP